jgi:hypothetical protein
VVRERECVCACARISARAYGPLLMAAAIHAKNRQHIGNRYVEIFPA